MNPLRPCVLLVLAAACHPSSSDSGSPPALTTNLGLTGTWAGTGSQRIVVESELDERRDRNGDGDALDQAAFAVDLELGAITNTGLAVGLTFSDGFGPAPLLLVGGPTLALGVSELATSGFDRNGDGDGDDIVLAFCERDVADVTNLGLAATHVVTSEDLVAFDSGSVTACGGLRQECTEPFVHDRRTGETWSLSAKGTAWIESVDGGFVALSMNEGVLGDLTGDGDTQDQAFALYDVSTRTLQLTGLPLLLGFEVTRPFPPIALGDRWAILSPDLETTIYDPATRTARTLGRFIQIGELPGIEPFVLREVRSFVEPLGNVWLYDPVADVLQDTGLAGSNVNALGRRLVIGVDEASQGEDLDQNGALDSQVPVLFDVATGAVENLGLDGMVVSSGPALLIHSREEFARRDWNDDGDRDDTVLFTWDEATSRVVNTHLAVPFFAGPLGSEFALVALDEDARSGDLNGDRDRLDHVLHVYDILDGRLRNLRLAVQDVPLGGGDRVLFHVDELDQGRDLNGDGDRNDRVIHMVGAASLRRD